MVESLEMSDGCKSKLPIELHDMIFKFSNMNQTKIHISLNFHNHFLKFPNYVILNFIVVKSHQLIVNYVNIFNIHSTSIY